MDLCDCATPCDSATVIGDACLCLFLVGHACLCLGWRCWPFSGWRCLVMQNRNWPSHSSPTLASPNIIISHVMRQCFFRVLNSLSAPCDFGNGLRNQWCGFHAHHGSRCQVTKTIPAHQVNVLQLPLLQSYGLQSLGDLERDAQKPLSAIEHETHQTNSDMSKISLSAIHAYWKRTLKMLAG